jgi:flagellar biosynthesis protein FliR
MSGLSALTAPYVETFFLVFLRVAALASVAPLLGHRTVPPLHRAALGLLIAIVVTPTLGAVGRSSHTTSALVLAIAGEILIGLGIGFVAMLVIAAAGSAGEAIGFSGGLSLAAAYDPSFGHESNVLARFMDVSVTLLFLAINGHHLLLRAVAASFTWITPGGLTQAAGPAGGLVVLGGKLLRSGVELAAPALGLLLVVNIVLALLTRVAPQMNVFSVGAPLMVAAAVFGLAESLPWAIATAGRLVGEIPDDVRRMLSGVGRGF